MNKEQQIEEMAKVMPEKIKDPLDNSRYIIFGKSLRREIARIYYNAGYRKIDKDNIVLSREEYEKLKQYEEKVKNGACFTQKEWLELCDEEYKRETENLSKVRQLERKETAREILNELIDSSNKITFFDCRMALGLDKLAKQYGVEVEECGAEEKE